MIMMIFLLLSVAATWQVALLLRHQSIADDLQCRLLHNSHHNDDDDDDDDDADADADGEAEVDDDDNDLFST